MNLCVGLGGATDNACVALCADGRVLAISEQERITRVRSAGFNRTGLPDEVLDALLRGAGRRREDVTSYAIGETSPAPDGVRLTKIDHHFAHACAAFLPSPFASATIVICDHESPEISVWDGIGTTITRVEWPWTGPGFASVYTQSARALGFGVGGAEQRMEALARLAPSLRDEGVAALVRLDDDHLRLEPGWPSALAERIAGGGQSDRIAVAAAVQTRISDLLVEFLTAITRRMPANRHLCVGGSLCYNSHINSVVKGSGLFEDVFIPINPGNAGLAVGTAMHAGGADRQVISPFLGPSYQAEEIKATLDNCKLTYRWASEAETIALAVEDLQRGRLVAWFDGSMEWGPRALGARSIIANPFAKYALENLNRFLKQREPWRGYALSGLESAVHDHFDGPGASPFMECDYVPKQPDAFREILPDLKAAVRVQTVGAGAPPRFQALLQAFGDATGIPILVNTSFNGFREPIVCSPRDAVRVFFGTGIDTLVVGQFVIRK